MALARRPLVAQLARDALARWANRATGLTPHLEGSSEPRPALPYVSLTFPRGRPSTGYRRPVELLTTQGEGTVLVTAGEGEACAVLVNSARAELTREVGEAAEDFSDRLAEELVWWLRGRCTAVGSGTDVVVTPLAPGLLLRLAAVEGCTVDAGLPGPPARLVQRLYRATCRVEVLGALAGQLPSTDGAGEGLDGYTIEAALREALSDPEVKADLKGALLVPHGSPDGAPSYASAVSGALRENRLAFEIEFGWTGYFAEDGSAILDVELELGIQAGEEQADLVLPLPITI